MISTWDTEDDSGPIVSVDRLQQLLARGNTVVIDARTPDQYRQVHIPGALQSDQNALRIPESSPAAIERYIQLATAEVRRLGLQRGQRIVFYEEASGTLSARGVWMLDFLGIPGGAMLDGGLIAWHNAGADLSQDPVNTAPSEIEVNPDYSVLGTADGIVGELGIAESSMRVLDTRADLEFASATIPGSVHVEWLNNLDPSGALRTRAELVELYRSAGFAPDSRDEVVTFCGSGYRAANSYVILKALGFQNVKNYVPSWGEWGRRSDLPKVRPSNG